MCRSKIVLVESFATRGFLPMKALAVKGCLSYLLYYFFTLGVSLGPDRVLDEIVFAFCFPRTLGFLFYLLGHCLSTLLLILTFDLGTL